MAFAYDKVTSYTFNHLSKFLVNIHQFVICSTLGSGIPYPVIYGRIFSILEKGYLAGYPVFEMAGYSVSGYSGCIFTIRYISTFFVTCQFIQHCV